MANVERLEFLEGDLEAVGRSSKLPILFQCNKQDIARTMSADDIAKMLVASRCRYVAASARKNEGILESLEALIALIDET